MSTDVVTAFAQAVLSCLVERLAVSVAGPVCSTRLVHAATVVPADECACRCTDPVGAPVGTGEAWVRVAQNTLVPDPGPCPTGRWSVRLELGSRRCVASLDEGGVPPDAGVLEAEARMLAGDAFAARQVLACCPVLADRTLTAVAQVPVGPAGGCAGWVTTLSAEVRERCPRC